MAETFGPTETSTKTRPGVKGYQPSAFDAVPIRQTKPEPPPDPVVVDSPPEPKVFANPAERLRDLAARKKRLVVDETADKIALVRHCSVVFRPGQVIIDAYLLDVAERNDIRLVER